MKLVNPDDITAFMGLSRDVADYPALEVIQNNVEISLSSFLGLDLENADRVIRSNIEGRMIALTALPVTSIQSVTVTPFGGVDIPLLPSSYTIMPYGIRLHGRYTGVASVAYNGGLLTKNSVLILPSISASEHRFVAALKKAALLQIVYEFERKDSIGSTTISTDGGTKSFKELTLLKAVKDLLVEFKHPLSGLQ